MHTQRIKRDVFNLHKSKDYRPTGVAILYYDPPTGQRKYLVVQSAKAQHMWSFPQGGKEQKESLEQCLLRELDEELGIHKNEIEDKIIGYYDEQLDAELSREDKRGFMQGKAYFFALMRYKGNTQLQLQQEEINNVKWLTYKQAVNYLKKGRKEKAELLIRGLEEAKKKLKK